LFLFVIGMFSKTIPLAALGWIVPISSFPDALQFALGFTPPRVSSHEGFATPVGQLDLVPSSSLL
jgi:ABC-type uncharacterized transport system permease subunit